MLDITRVRGCAEGIRRQDSRVMGVLRCALSPVTQPQLDAESHGDVRRMQQVGPGICAYSGNHLLQPAASFANLDVYVYVMSHIGTLCHVVYTCDTHYVHVMLNT